MNAGTTTLLHHLVDDRPAVGTAPTAVSSRHAALRTGPHASVLGCLVVPDTALQALARARPAGPEEGSWPVSVEIPGGAGGVAALAVRSAPGLEVAAVETVLRDLDDLTGNVARIAAAAATLGDVDVLVELPERPGWVRAVEAAEAAGLLARVTTGADVTPAALSARLSVLVEADLPFTVVLPPGQHRPGLTALALAMLVEALVDGAESDEAAALLAEAEPGRVRSGLSRWEAATAARVRRRLRSVSTDATAVVDDLEDLGILDRQPG